MLFYLKSPANDRNTCGSPVLSIKEASNAGAVSVPETIQATLKEQLQPIETNYQRNFPI